MHAAFWSDNNQMKMHNWAAQSVGQDGNFCVSLNGNDGKWYLQDCNIKLPYMCKVTNGKRERMLPAHALRVLDDLCVE